MKEIGAYRIRPGRESDAAKLPAIEGAAARVFSNEDVPAAMTEEVTDVAEIEAAVREGRVIVLAERASDEPIGFALLEVEERELHLAELDVHPDHARRGLGGELLRAVIEHARANDFTAVTLTTFRHLRWNAPFYERHGFRILEGEALSFHLACRLEDEAASGLDPEKRVAMMHVIEGP